MLPITRRGCLETSLMNTLEPRTRADSCSQHPVHSRCSKHRVRPLVLGRGFRRRRRSFN